MFNIIINHKKIAEDIKNNILNLLEENYIHCVKSHYNKAGELYRIAYNFIKLSAEPNTEVVTYNIKKIKESIDLIKQDYLFCLENNRTVAAIQYKIVIDLMTYILYIANQNI